MTRHVPPDSSGVPWWVWLPVFSLSVSGRSSCLLSPHTLTLPPPPGTWGTDSPPLLPGVIVAIVGHTLHRLVDDNCCGVS